MHILLLVDTEQPVFTLQAHVPSETQEHIPRNACTCGHRMPNQHAEASSSTSIPQASVYPSPQEWLIMFFATVLIVGWVMVAMITQNYFLLSSIPALATLLAYTLRWMIDSVCCPRKAKVALPPVAQ
jgi:hypothetical protein